MPVQCAGAYNKELCFAQFFFKINKSYIVK